MAWEVKNIEDCMKLIDYRGRTPEKTESGIRLITAKNVKLGYLELEPQEFIASNNYDAWMTRGIPNIGDVIFTTEAPLANVAQIDTIKKLAFAQRIIVMQPDRKILDPTFLKYALLSPPIRSEILEKGTGATVQGIKSSLLKKIEIPIPPLAEQKRIVAMLDSSFSAISKAKENAEKNLKNSKELFESYLNNIFEKKGKDWEEKKLGECFKLRSGENLTSKQMNKQGLYPVFGGNGIAGMHDAFNLTENNVIIGRVGALCGNVRLIKEKIWLTDNAFKITDFKYEFDYSYLTYLLNFKNLRNFARQAAQPVISNSSLESVSLSFPKSLSEQKRIVAKLDALSEQTKKLEAVYLKKIADLDELKKSILQKAFRGEL